MQYDQEFWIWIVGLLVLTFIAFRRNTQPNFQKEFKKQLKKGNAAARSLRVTSPFLIFLLLFYYPFSLLNQAVTSLVFMTLALINAMCLGRIMIETEKFSFSYDKHILSGFPAVVYGNFLFWMPIVFALFALLAYFDSISFLTTR